MKAIHNIKDELTMLNNMIGMHSLKDSICDQIIYFIQDLHNLSPNNEDFMHTVIYGPPGTGKTETAKIMGKIFSKMGILKRGTFKKATRSDLVAGYLGQTALKTRDLIKECLGGVLFIDEAYALGNPEKRDSFAKEAIDTLCEGLSDHKKDLMVIIAGYEEELKSCFFNYNAGLESRFTWRFKTDDYKPEELMAIFKKKVYDSNWSVKDKALKQSWFEEKMPYFKYYGRDMETLFSKCKIAHSRRVFCKPKKDKTILTMKDLDKGFEIYISNDEVKNRKDDDHLAKNVLYSMYC
jgi:SpoVK/Ycf46/Vps4 family AAA+-type ATPase